MFHHIRPLIQFTPARAKKKLEIDELTAVHASYLTDQKIDGERYILHTEVGGPFRHGLTSRRQSEVTGRFVEKTDRVPHLTNIDGLPPKSLFDNELVSSGDMILVDLPGKFWDKLLEPNHPHMMWLKNKYNGALPCYPHVANTVSIMGSLGPEAVRKQEERGLIWAYCFDIIQYQGKNLTENNQLQRRRFLAAQLQTINPELGMVLMPTWNNLTLSEIEFLFYLVTDDEGEGLILKDPTQKYNGPKNWYKIKRDYPADCVYTGDSKLGEAGKTGQMLGMAASLEIGVYHHDLLIPVGWVSGIRQGFHTLQTPEEHRKTWAGKAVEVRHNGLQKDDTSPLGYTLRHPRYRRTREDKNPTDCTWDALYEEASKKLG